jgi:hypothetical protein
MGTPLEVPIIPSSSAAFAVNVYDPASIAFHSDSSNSSRVGLFVYTHTVSGNVLFTAHGYLRDSPVVSSFRPSNFCP